MTTPTIRIRTRPQLQAEPDPEPTISPPPAMPAVPQWLDEPSGSPIVRPKPPAPAPVPTRQKRKRPKKAERVLGDYEVGYCKPPQATKWTEGFCPNPRGRPKKSKSLDEHLEDALNERIRVQQGGRSKKVTRKEALVKQLLGDALQGNAKARDLIFRRNASPPGGGQALDPAATEALHHELDWEILNDFAREIGGRLPGGFAASGSKGNKVGEEPGDA